MSYNLSSQGQRVNYHDAPEILPYDNSHNAPETVPLPPHDPYVLPKPYGSNEKVMNDVNPKIMEVGIGYGARGGRRLGDMRASRFWIALAVVCILVIGATVGGAVGGSLAARKNGRSESASEGTATPIPTIAGASFPSSSTSTSSESISISTPTPSSTLPTSTPKTIAPASPACQNGTLYQSLFQNGLNGSPGNAGLTFTRLCQTASKDRNIGSAYSYSLEDCIEICAGINFWAGDRRCKGVVYRAVGGRPVNCWAVREVELYGDVNLHVGLLV